MGEDGRQLRIWAFVMVLGWSRASCVEFVRRADTASELDALFALILGNYIFVYQKPSLT